MRLKITQIFCLFLVSVALNSCSRSLLMKVYNGSGEQVEITNTMLISGDQSKKLLLSDRFFQSETEPQMTLSISSGKCVSVFNYNSQSSKVRPFLPDIRKDQGWTINAQIDKKMNIYLLPFDIEPPVESDQLEKIGYKLPRESKVCS